MTEKIYYDDAYRQTFTARVEERRLTQRGSAVRLNCTAFYPTSGGQPHDTGTLDGIPVVDVWVDSEGEIWHLLAGEPGTGEPETGEIRGVIDWDRRFDHMQQHTGQHLLSAAFMRRLEAPTVGFHLGSEHCTIDLDLARLSTEAAFCVEEEINAIIWDDRPVEARFITDGELRALALRRDPQVEDNVRIVSVEGYDATPCGGTHVARTGEIGQVKITGLERYKGGMRVSFLCGKRALHDYRRVLQLAQDLGTELTVAQDEVPEAVRRLQEEIKETRRALNRSRSQLLDIEAEQIWETTPTREDVKWIVAHW
ncbi:MAG: alanyl-tRNA editing protein, partial [Anaerolineae bacterium]